MSSQKPPAFPNALRHKFIQDLEALFELAIQKEDFSAALKAKELLGKEQGFFEPHQDRTKEKKAGTLQSFEQLTDEELAALIQQLEHQSS